ncbi:peptidylprolyl isomerase [Candidatus Micrarchaeota archaeon]|nr:peptidylprolyl isomerase [Candidatus Micrarchaeota archaeon]
MMVKASHILVPTEHKAKWIYKELKKGRDFEKLAKEYSECPSRMKGGNLGFFERGQMTKEFEDVAFSLKEGEISKPVKTEFGYHIIKLLEKKK